MMENFYNAVSGLQPAKKIVREDSVLNTSRKQLLVQNYQWKHQ